ncbi:2-hydroxyacid dehydrogenase [Candidatus Acidulodesulfobacterium sp. H_13]|uniref:2-hydroxyacid dehydrogenase n=1 Tax=Candidatus Acidulodesulfobacterium sp. H_13 TaxID=3395470 RepID=UPI003AF9D5E8
MNIIAILRSKEMFGILKPYLPGHNIAHYTDKKDFLDDIKDAGHKNLSVLADDLILIVNAGIEIDKDVLSFAGIKLIQQFGVGYENVDIDYASEKGIPVFNTPTAGTYNAVSVAELTLFFIIALARDYNGCINAINHGVANQPMGSSIFGKKFGIVGLGGVGLEIVRLLKVTGGEIYGLKHNKPADDYAKNLGIKFAGTIDNDFKYMLSLVDYVILAVPLEKNTENLINDETVDLMKTGSYIINTGRAGLIKKSSLINGLKSGKIKGAGLDVYWKEPVHISDEIFHFNVIATPHIGGATYESIGDISRMCAENITGWLEKGDLTNCVNKDLITKN